MNWIRWPAYPIPQIALLLAWGTLINLIGLCTWGCGVRTFFLLLALIGLFLLATCRPKTYRSGGEGFTGLHRKLTLAFLALLLTGFLLLHFSILGGNLRASPHAPLSDIGADTDCAARTLFLEKGNPYTTRCQLEQDVSGAFGAQVEGGQVKLFGLPYFYGYPYFPIMFLAYSPFLYLAPGYHAIRLGNALWFLLNLVGVAWLARRLAPDADPAFVPLAAVLAYSGVLVWGSELFNLGVTDLVISMLAVFALVALTHERPILAGLLLGMAQAAKLTPGVFLILVLFWWAWGKSFAWKFYATTVVTTLAVQLPFLLWDPAGYVSGAILFHMTLGGAASGDSTSLHYYLPTALQTPFVIVGILTLLGYLVVTFLRPKRGLVQAGGVAFVAFLILIAFNKVIHLNHIWGIYGLGCAVLAGGGFCVPQPRQEE